MSLKLGAQTFTVPTPGAMTSFALQQRILPIAGRIVHVFLTLVGAAGGTPADLLKADVAQSLPKLLPVAMPAIGEIFSQMPAGELEALTRALLGEAKFNNMPLFGTPGGDAFDGIMQGRALDTWRLLWHALQVWYPDFFKLADGLTVGVAKVSPSAQSAISPPNGPATG